ncbi:MAG: hypothetical protein HOB29_12310 [Planctomycetaceae bacterium]|nr:hypothetical protein [Planctomycetaceae bacterium]
MAAQELLAIKEQILSIHQAAELALIDENRDSILGPETTPALWPHRTKYIMAAK